MGITKTLTNIREVNFRMEINTMPANISKVIRIADGVETNSPEMARKLRQILIHYSPDREREIAAEILRHRRATRRANNQTRG